MIACKYSIAVFFLNTFFLKSHSLSTGSGAPYDCYQLSSWNINQELMVPITSANMAPNTLDFTPPKSPITGWNPLCKLKNQAWTGQLKQLDENTKILQGPTITRPHIKLLSWTYPFVFKRAIEPRGAFKPWSDDWGVRSCAGGSAGAQAWTGRVCTLKHILHDTFNSFAVTVQYY